MATPSDKLAELQRQLEAIESAKAETDSALRQAVAEQQRGADRSGSVQRRGASNTSPLRGEARAAWERAVIEDELSRPLEVDSTFIKTLATKEAETEARLLAELRVHAAALDTLRQRLLDREAAAERAYSVKVGRDGGSTRVSPVVAAGKGGVGAGAGAGALRRDSSGDRAFQTFTATEGHVLGSLQRLQELESRIRELEQKTSGSDVADVLGLAPITATMTSGRPLATGSKGPQTRASDAKLEAAYGTSASRSASNGKGRPGAGLGPHGSTASAAGPAGAAGVAADIGVPAAGFAPALGLVYNRKKVPGTDGSPAKVVYAVESLERVTARADLGLGLGLSAGHGAASLLGAGTEGVRKPAAAPSRPGPGPSAVVAPRMARSMGPSVGRRGPSIAPTAPAAATRGRPAAVANNPLATGGPLGRAGAPGTTIARAKTVAIGNDIAQRLAAERARQANKAGAARAAPPKAVPGSMRTDRLGARNAASKAALSSFEDVRKRFEAQKGAIRGVTGPGAGGPRSGAPSAKGSATGTGANTPAKSGAASRVGSVANATTATATRRSVAPTASPVGTMRATARTAAGPGAAGAAGGASTRAASKPPARPAATQAAPAQRRTVAGSAAAAAAALRIGSTTAKPAGPAVTAKPAGSTGVGAGAAAKAGPGSGPGRPAPAGPVGGKTTAAARAAFSNTGVRMVTGAAALAGPGLGAGPALAVGASHGGTKR